LLINKVYLTFLSIQSIRTYCVHTLALPIQMKKKGNYILWLTIPPKSITALNWIRAVIIIFIIIIVLHIGAMYLHIHDYEIIYHNLLCLWLQANFNNNSTISNLTQQHTTQKTWNIIFLIIKCKYHPITSYLAYILIES
jgi:hypothetical protein